MEKSARSRVAGAVAVIGALVVLVPGVAGALQIDYDYDGRIKGAPQTDFAFNVDKVAGKRVVRYLRMKVPVDCDGQDLMTVAQVDGKLPIRKAGRFSGRRSAVTEMNPTGQNARAVVRGRLLERGRARGTVRFTETVPAPNRRGATVTCRSGTLDWVARRVQN